MRTSLLWRCYDCTTRRSNDPEVPSAASPAMSRPQGNREDPESLKGPDPVAGSARTGIAGCCCMGGAVVSETIGGEFGSTVLGAAGRLPTGTISISAGTGAMLKVLGGV